MQKKESPCDGTEDVACKNKLTTTEFAKIKEMNNVVFEKYGLWDYFDNVKPISMVQFLKMLKVLNTSISEFGNRIEKKH